MSIRRLILPAMALALLAAPPADAASPTETLKSFFASANTILQSADPMRGLEAPRRGIRELVDQVFDYQEAAELVLGPVWQTRTPAERTEFVQLFADFLERGFVAMIGSKASVAAGVTVQYLGEFIDGESATVTTSVLTRNGGDLPVEYSMLRWGDRWMVRDVVIEGVSLIANYRAQFFRVIRASSYAGLIARMRGDGDESFPRERKFVVTVETVPVPPVPVSAVPIGRAPVVPIQAVAPIQRVDLIPAAPAPALTASRLPSVEPAPVASPPPPVASPPPPVASPPPPVAPPPSLVPAPAAASTPAAAPSTLRASVMAATTYWVQVGAFKTVSAATRVAAELRRAGLAAWNGAPATLPGKSEPELVRVRVGPYTSRADAQSKLHELVTRGYTPFIAEARN
jgi:phospholipid transport system substrate-binding protein